MARGVRGSGQQREEDEEEKEELFTPLPWMRAGRRSILRVNCLIPFLFITSIVVVFMIIIGRVEKPKKLEWHMKYETVTGYFLQDDPGTESNGFDYSKTNFGLIDRSYDTDLVFDPDQSRTQWQRFENALAKLNSESSENMNYKVLFMGRHGEGYHNVAEAFYGTKNWDCYWSLQPGNETTNWTDALLTPVGIAQAQKAHDFWASQITNQKIPTPESYYTSPLLRCCATASVTFSGLDLPETKPFTPTVKELFREVIGAHTCDKRSSKSIIAKEYPSYVFEDGFVEEDKLFKARERETSTAQDQRTKKVLDDVFENDVNSWISVSSHSGEIGSLLRVLGHRDFGLGTGQVIPVLVQAERVEGAQPPDENAPWDRVVACEKPKTSGRSE